MLTRRRDTLAFNSKRMLFINGQVVKGNLKPKRTRRRTEVFQRLLNRLEVNRLVGEEDTEK